MDVWHPFHAGAHYAHEVSSIPGCGCMNDTPSMLVITMHIEYLSVQSGSPGLDAWHPFYAGAHHVHEVSINAIRQSRLWIYDKMLVLTMHMEYLSVLSSSPGYGCMTLFPCWWSPCVWSKFSILAIFGSFVFLQYHICLTLPANQWTKELIKAEWSWRIGSSMTMPVPVVSEGAYFSNRPFFILFFQTSAAWCKLNSFFPIKCMCWSKHVLVQRRMQQKEFEQH